MTQLDDDYLWNKTGTSDPDLVRLERMLAPVAWNPAVGPRVQPDRNIGRQKGRRRSLRSWYLATTLAACALVIASWLQLRLMWPTDAAWAVLASEGQVDWSGNPTNGLQVGDGLTTGPDGEVRLQVARIGELSIRPQSRLRLIETRSGRHRVQLLEGEVQARVWAPPHQFGMDLPGVALWDLGCIFTVRTKADGHGLLTVQSGWVQLEDGAKEVLVPEGAQVFLASNGKVGTPHHAAASPAFLEALRRIDEAAENIPPDSPLLQQLATEARTQDAITLITLLNHQPRWADSPIFPRLGVLFPGSGVTREAVWQRDPRALDAWWDALPYPRVKHWWWQWRDALPLADPELRR